MNKTEERKNIMPMDQFCQEYRIVEAFVYNSYNKAIIHENKNAFVNLDLLHLGGRKKNDIRTKKIGFIYLVEAEGLNRYKIGITGNVKDRIKRIQTSSPVKVNLITSSERVDFKELEIELHEDYRKNRVIGEWFELNQEELEAITKRVMPL